MGDEMATFSERLKFLRTKENLTQKQLAEKLEINYLDIEDFYFPYRHSSKPYSIIRTKEEVEKLLLESCKQGNFVLASVDASFSKEVLNYIEKVIVIDVPKEIRLQRVKDRSYQQFEKRMLEGGDLYEKEQKFFQRVASRDESMVEDSLQEMSHVIHIDGTKHIDEIIDELILHF